MSEEKECGCMKCEIVRKLDATFELMFVTFVRDVVDKNLPKEDIQQRLELIADILCGIVVSTSTLVEKFEAFMKERDQDFPMQFFYKILIHAFVDELQSRKVAVIQPISATVFDQMKPIDKSMLN